MFLRLLCISVVIAWASSAAAEPQRPNIVWIIGENLCHDLGCYGAKHVATPNLDRLAAEGVRYTNVFATAPVCSASRSAFMVGMYQTTTDTHQARSHRDDGYQLPGGARPITYRLREAGYLTGNVVKIGDEVVGTGKVDLNFDVGPKLYDTAEWSRLIAQRPFFAQVNTPEVEMDIYDRQTWRKPRVEWVGEREHEPIAKPEDVTPPPYYPDHKIVREEWARFLNSVSGIDRRVGAILSALDRDDAADDTIVVFFGDNGRLEPRGIHWCYDSGLRVPLIIRYPKNFPPPADARPGTVSDRMLSLLDVTATTLEMAGIAKPAGMQSQIFLGPNAESARTVVVSARDRIDESVQRIRTVRDSRYRYIRNFLPEQGFTSLNRYKEKCFLIMPLMRELKARGELHGPPLALLQDRLPPEELYDLETDPYEIRNLATSNDPVHRAALGRLRDELERWMKETGDRGSLPEPQEIVAPFEKEMHDWFGTPEWYRAGR